MKILHCDCCHTEVNIYGHWCDDKKPKCMYVLNSVHEYGEGDKYQGVILCQDCIQKLLSEVAEQNGQK